ncbi:MAG: hypothetical protein H3C30_13975 [Candidatus Hydrogenedentes bacterium]|nr:hypothetical protein [Candidatus Hydrogenedentota bacterium]
MPTDSRQRDLTHDLVLPTLLFAALGGMTWAVRGCSGYGAMAGCMFAGVGWGTAWWFIARRSGGAGARPYRSGWIILAMTFGVGISGARGWMQWSSFFDGKLTLNAAEGVFVPISPAYGFLWLFIAGVPWAGIGACMLAWCASDRTLRGRDWFLRIGCGVGGVVIARFLFEQFPALFLPLYDTLRDQYQDFQTNPSLRRLVGDNRLAVMHLGAYLGFLAYEAGRRDRRNVLLILTVGLVNGAGWSLLHHWKWAPKIWPEYQFNWWRCWESSGGISIGIALGLAYYLVNRPQVGDKGADSFSAPRPNLERFGVWLGLLLGLGLSTRNGLKGWANIYLGNEEYWSGVLWMFFGPALLLGIILTVICIVRNPLPAGFPGKVFPRDQWLMWLTLLVLNVLAQLVTGPHSAMPETSFSVYYALLFLVTAVIVAHYQRMPSPNAA